MENKRVTGFSLRVWARRLFFGPAKELNFLEEEQVQSPMRSMIKRFLHNKVAMTGVTIFVACLLLVIIGPIFLPLDLSFSDATQQNVPPTMSLASPPKALLDDVKEISAGTTYGIGCTNSGEVYTWGYTKITSTIDLANIPDEVKEMLESDNYELAFVCSEYESATPKVNKQIAKIDKIVKAADKSTMVIGEAPLMKDLQDVTDVDLQTVNTISIIAIFIIILLVFKSFLLPVILVAVIEFAIFINMAIPFYQGTSLPFVASIVIGTIQLGATVDYAILMTSRYQKERLRGKAKMEAISIAHKTSMLSIISSGLSFFAATFGVALYSKVDMIGSICTLLARGALISMFVVILILPAMFMIFDKPIIMTTFGKSPELKALKERSKHHEQK